MSIEQLALLGIAIFGFIALVQAFSTARAIKRTTKQKGQGRLRRLVGGDMAARTTAMDLVKDLKKKYPEMTQKAKETGQLPEKLDKALEEVQLYYRDRVEPRHRPLFYVAVNEVIFEKESTPKNNEVPH